MKKITSMSILQDFKTKLKLFEGVELVLHGTANQFETKLGISIRNNV